jgi:hypothetical protein
MPRRPFTRWLAAVLALASLSACVSNATVVDRKATPEQAAGKAIVIVSISHDRTASGSAHFYIDGGTPDAVKVESAAGHMELPIKNHFHDKFGHVYVLEMPPGHHRFTAWNASWRDRRTDTISGLAPLEFDAARGDVVYIGNLHVQWVLNKMWLVDKKYPAAAIATVKDESAADIPIAERSNPAIAGRVRIALLPLGPWGTVPPGAARGDASIESKPRTPLLPVDPSAVTPSPAP